MWDFPFLPNQASTFAAEVDAFYFALVGVTAFFTIAIYAMIWWFSVRYRRGKKADRSNAPTSNHLLEAVWIIIPLGISLAIFGWSAKIFFEIKTPPQDAMQVHAIGKQWMWKFVNEDGKYEVNELHVPVGRAVEIKMISQDVLHDLYFPAFRTKQDVLPGRYTTLWFEATTPGTYHMFCAEYCGLLHSGMIGKVHVLTQDDYDAWLADAGGSATASSGGGSGNALVDGAKLFEEKVCHTCHKSEATAIAPTLVGVYGTDVQLQDGTTVTVDDAYIRESIKNPGAKIVAGYQPAMPTYEGQITEEQIVQLIAYIKSLK
ncbi:MAG: cytochrome c oxidase subunit II [Ignavibacteriae bacterium]|nr:cytochrome c oxidase subunit II [Ignavibacteriota bacterium]MCB9216200.1 cytochrome c oxidase subunit II [Ignavibacteria bacterium]